MTTHDHHISFELFRGIENGKDTNAVDDCSRVARLETSFEWLRRTAEANDQAWIGSSSMVFNEEG